LSQEQKDKKIAGRQKERMNSSNSKPRKPYPPQQSNAHEADEVVDIDDIINYTMLNHNTNVDDDDDKGITNDGDDLPAYIAGCSSLAGDIRQVMATNTKIPHKGKSVTTSCKVNRLQVQSDVLLV
jgi:hypothetical protein